MTHLDRLAARALAENIPLSALFELTGRCNLDCRHCYLDIRHPPRDELGTDEAFDVLRQLRAAGTLFLTLTGGEIFLRPDALTIAAEARRLGFGVRLFTSGTRLGRAEADAIAGLGVLAVELSLYSHRAAIHDAITRRPGSQHGTLRAAAMLRRRGVPVLLKAPLLDGAAGDFAGILALASRIGAECKIDTSVITRRDGNLAPAATRAAPEALIEALRDPRVLPERALPAPAPADRAPCAIARRTCRIAPNGDVFPCSTFPIPAGNLRGTSFSELWRSSPLLAHLRSIRVGDLAPTCSGCDKSGYCGRCLALSLLEHGDLLGPSDEACRVAEAKERALGVDRPRRERAGRRVRLPVIA